MNQQELLERAFQNEKNERILDTSIDEIHDFLHEIMDYYPFDKITKKEYRDKLVDYLPIEDIDDLHTGTHLRYFSVDEESPLYLELQKGALLIEIQEREGEFWLVMKNYGPYGKYFQLAFDDYEFFRKWTSQEEILLVVMDHLSKKNINTKAIHNKHINHKSIKAHNS
jgi:hypothetical protein